MLSFFKSFQTENKNIKIEKMTSALSFDVFKGLPTDPKVKKLFACTIQSPFMHDPFSIFYACIATLGRFHVTKRVSLSTLKKYEGQKPKCAITVLLPHDEEEARHVYSSYQRWIKKLHINSRAMLASLPDSQTGKVAFLPLLRTNESNGTITYGMECLYLDNIQMDDIHSNEDGIKTEMMVLPSKGLDEKSTTRFNGYGMKLETKTENARATTTEQRVSFLSESVSIPVKMETSLPPQRLPSSSMEWKTSPIRNSSALVPPVKREKFKTSSSPVARKSSSALFTQNQRTAPFSSLSSKFAQRNNVSELSDPSIIPKVENLLDRRPLYTTTSNGKPKGILKGVKDEIPKFTRSPNLASSYDTLTPNKRSRPLSSARDSISMFSSSLKKTRVDAVALDRRQGTLPRPTTPRDPREEATSTRAEESQAETTRQESRPQLTLFQRRAKRAEKAHKANIHSRTLPYTRVETNQESRTALETTVTPSASEVKAAMENKILAALQGLSSAKAANAAALAPPLAPPPAVLLPEPTRQVPRQPPPASTRQAHMEMEFISLTNTPKNSHKNDPRRVHDKAVWNINKPATTMDTFLSKSYRNGAAMERLQDQHPSQFTLPDAEIRDNFRGTRDMFTASMETMLGMYHLRQEEARNRMS